MTKFTTEIHRKLSSYVDLYKLLYCVIVLTPTRLSYLKKEPKLTWFGCLTGFRRMASKTFPELVHEELPLQSASVDMEGGSLPSCMALFDRYLSCYCEHLPSLNTSLSDYLEALRSQFFSLYRNGHASLDCSAKWDDFKFCLSARTLSDDRKREAWVRRRAEWWAGRRQEGSSEAIWEAKQ